MDSGGTPLAKQISVTPSIIARDGSSGDVDTLWIATSPVVMSQYTMSVNVPPTSTPITLMVAEPRLRLKSASPVGPQRFQQRIHHPCVNAQAPPDIRFVSVLSGIVAAAADAGHEQHRRRGAPREDHRIMPCSARHAQAARALGGSGRIQ